MPDPELVVRLVAGLAWAVFILLAVFAGLLGLVLWEMGHGDD